MEISEYLNRINLKSADTTLYKKEEREVKVVRDGQETIEKRLGISTYTYCENGSVGITGFLTYIETFPDVVFAMNPDVLNKMLQLSNYNISIEETFLVARTDDIEIKKDLSIKKWRKAHAKYDNSPILFKNNIIQRIINADALVDSSYITLVGNGKELTITLFPKEGNGEAKLTIPTTITTNYRFDGPTLVEVLKLVGNLDAKFYMDTLTPEGRRKSPMRINVTDNTSQIAYYITEVAAAMSQTELKETKKTKKEEKEETEKEEEKVIEDSEELGDMI